MVQNLNSVHKSRHQNEQRDFVRRQRVIRRQFPWATHKNNTVPNHFIHGSASAPAAPSSAQTGPAPDLPHIVLLHQHRAAGSAIKHCLDELAQKQYFPATSPLFRSDTRYLWDKKKNKQSLTQKKLQVHAGQFAFGLCNDLSGSCSYGTLLRDPMESRISSYYHCKTHLSDEMCTVGNANEMSLRQWILHHGNLLFRQLLFQSHWCQVTEKFNSSALEVRTSVELERQPCWYKHKLSFEELSPEDVHHLLEYVLDNLGTWFSVIGLFEELRTSIQMFEKVYQFPFTQCSAFQNIDSFHDEFSNRAHNKRHETADPEESDPEYLKYDFEVQEAMHADVKIYKKAKTLFRMQKQTMLNQM